MDHIRIMVRLYIAGQLHSEESLDLATAEDLEGAIPKLAMRHAEMVAGRPFMLEFEFLDEPPPARFVRFGTDPSRMIQPRSISIGRA